MSVVTGEDLETSKASNLNREVSYSGRHRNKCQHCWGDFGADKRNTNQAGHGKRHDHLGHKLDAIFETEFDLNISNARQHKGRCNDFKNDKS